MPDNRNQGFSGGRQGGQGGGHREDTSHKEAAGGATGLMTNVLEGAENVASSVATTAGHAWDATRHGVESAASTVAGAAESAFDDATAFLRRYPMATLGAGIALGFVLSMALRGGNRS